MSRLASHLHPRHQREGDGFVTPTEHCDKPMCLLDVFLVSRPSSSFPLASPLFFLFVSQSASPSPPPEAPVSPQLSVVAPQHFHVSAFLTFPCNFRKSGRQECAKGQRHSCNLCVRQRTSPPRTSKAQSRRLFDCSIGTAPLKVNDSQGSR